MTAFSRQEAAQTSLWLQRKYSIAYLHPDGDIREVTRYAPAIPAFEDAFAVFGRGTMVDSHAGLIAIEDLLPGDRLRLRAGHFARVLWRGKITVMPDETTADAAAPCLTRVMADAFGADRPRRDLILGPAARLCYQTAGISRLTGKSAAYIPAADFVDGHQFVALRPHAPVDLYQVGFAGQETLIANGIGVESLHPGTAFSLGLRGQSLSQYLSLFPHLRDLEDAGLMTLPRLRLHDLDLLK
ncbi:Hint domain-containing protein [Yoonia sp.]|uniref:Hint domain-containing protein n=1 Tax=Yoonia sp. TaxID=2212373 RepID=UPI003919888F